MKTTQGFLRSLIYSACLLTASFSQAQHSFYVNAGYALAASKGPLQISTDLTLYNGIRTNSIVYGSYGKGFRYGLGYGYSVGKYFEVEGNYERVNGATYSSSYHQLDTKNYLPNYRTDVTTSISSEIWMAGLNLKFKTEGFFQDKGYLFLKGGGIAGTGKLNSNTEFSTNNPSALKIIYEEEYFGVVSWGAQMALGMELVVRSNISLHGQLVFTSLRYSAKKSSIVSFKANNVDVLGDLTTNEKETIYLDTLTTVENGIESPDMPKGELRNTYPLSSLSFQIGVQIKIDKKGI